MLTATQATAVAEYLAANTPCASGELDHSHISAWQMSCEALELLGYATETTRGVLLHPTPVLPGILPRWDDACCVILSAAHQTSRIQLRHSWSLPNDETGPGSADPETAELLGLLGLTLHGTWTEEAASVLWRTAPEEARTVAEGEFAAQAEQAVATVPDRIGAQIRSIHAEHGNPTVREHLVDWIFFEAWRWGDGWVTDERRGRPLGIFHDPLAQRMRAAVAGRIVCV
jgi:hypothetical protein